MATTPLLLAVSVRKPAVGYPTRYLAVLHYTVAMPYCHPNCTYKGTRLQRVWGTF